MLVKRYDASAPQVPVTPERAQKLIEELRSYQTSGDSSSLSPGEDNFIRAVWSKKPGHWNYMMTLVSIAKPER